MTRFLLLLRIVGKAWQRQIAIAAVIASGAAVPS
jgi:hypothetical protein